MVSRHPRFKVDLTVDCSTKDVFLANHVTNISKGGLFMETKHPLPLESEVLLTFTLPEIRATVQAKGRVVWTYDIKKGTSRVVPGTGIKFTELAPHHKALLEDYLERLAQRHELVRLDPVSNTS